MELWAAVNRKGMGLLFNECPTRYTLSGTWCCPRHCDRVIRIPKEFLKTKFNIEITWESEPIKIL